MKQRYFGVLVMLGAVLVGLCSAPVMAWQDPICKTFTEGSEEWLLAGCKDDGEMALFEKVPGVVTAVFGLAAIVAVAVVILGGVRYTTSQGDPGKVKKAKDTILYAIVGLVVTLMAYAIVGFVLENIA